MRWVLVVFLLMAPLSVWAYRPEQPSVFIDLTNSNEVAKLNDVLLQLFNVTNGRYATDVVTSDPDGTRRGDAGQPVLWMNGTSASLCVNTNNATDWDCVALTD